MCPPSNEEAEAQANHRPGKCRRMEMQPLQLRVCGLSHRATALRESKTETEITRQSGRQLQMAAGKNQHMSSKEAMNYFQEWDWENQAF
jgi:hypothetical protein